MGWMHGVMRHLRDKKIKKEVNDLVIKPEVRVMQGKTYVSFKAGIDRLYVVNNLTYFIQNYARKRTIVLGSKTELDLGVHRIEKESQPLFDFLYTQVCKEMDKRVPLQKYMELTGERLRLFQALCKEKGMVQFYLDREKDRILCQPKFRYEKHEDQVFVNTGEDKKYEAFRDLEWEGKVIHTVKRWFPHANPETGMWYCEENANIIERLQETGWNELKTWGEVYVTPRFQKIKVKKASKMKMGVSIKGDLLSLQVDEKDPASREWMEILAQYEPKKQYYRLTEGEYVKVEEEDLDTLKDLFETMNVSCKDFVLGKMHLPAYRALYLHDRMEKQTAMKLEQDDTVKRLISNMKEPKRDKFVIPKHLDGIMREYQKEGFRWLKTLGHYGFGGILADDMGLGKTLQVIAMLLSEKESGVKGTSLIVVPASLVYNWKAEFQRFAPKMKVSLITGKKPERVRSISEYKKQDVLITSYDLIKRDIVEYEDAEFLYHILDEAQYIKNHGTATAKTVKLIQSKHRLALTGTPIENRLSELWSIFDFLMPGFLHSYETFRRRWERNIVSHNEKESWKQLKTMVAPFILRRKKEDVLKDLPEKLEEICYVALEKEQQKIYDAGVFELRNTLDSLEEGEFQREKIGILAAITKLRQICCGPELLYEKYKGSSAKRDACMELVKRACESGHKLLLFSQFTSVLTMLEGDLEKDGITYYRIDGSTSKQRRLELVNAFNQDDTQVFLISLKAGGTGLNLTGADVVIHYDPWWNQAATNQATDRAHRFGQTRPVSVYKMVAKNTIEEKIIQLQEKKQDLAEQILSGETTSLGQMKKEEILALFM